MPLFATVNFFELRAGAPYVFASLRVDRDASAARCPGVADLRAEVRARLGYDAFDEGQRRQIHVRFFTQGRALHGEFSLLSDEGVVLGSRSLTSAARDCRELRSAIALAISVAVEQLRLHDALERSAVAPTRSPHEVAIAPTPLSTQRTPSAPYSDQAPRATPDPPRVYTERLRAVLAFGAQGSLGVQPSVAFGFDASVGLRWRRVVFAIEGRVQPSARVDGAAGAHAVTEWYGGLFAGCVALPWSELCGTVQGGVLQASGRNVDRPRSAAAWTVSAGLRASVVVPVLSGFEVRALLDLSAPFTTVRFSLADASLWETPRLNGTVGLRVAAMIP